MSQRRRGRVDRNGFATAYVRCRRCRAVGSYKFTPYGCQPVFVTCGCLEQKPDFESLTQAEYRTARRARKEAPK